MTRKPVPALNTAPFELAEAKAIQQLARGEANEEEQRRALQWIINDLCRVGKVPFAGDDEGGDRATNVLIGRLFVGNQILRLANTNLEDLKTEVHARKGERDG